MGTLESVDDGATRQRAPTEELAERTRREDALRHQDSGASRGAAAMSTTDELGFVDRHLGPDSAEIAEMLATIGRASLDDLIGATVPSAIGRLSSGPHRFSPIRVAG